MILKLSRNCPVAPDLVQSVMLGSTRLTDVTKCGVSIVIPHFLWTRGTIEQGRIHNPHYFDWLFNGGNQENNNVEMMENNMCNEEVLPHVFQLRSYIRDTSDLNENQKQRVLRLYRQLEHNVSVDLVRYRTAANGERVNVFQNLISYIKNKGQPAKNFESFTMKQNLYNEMYTILNNYKRNQIHLFNALLSKNIELQQFLDTHGQNKTIFNECIQNFNRFYKKKLQGRFVRLPCKKKKYDSLSSFHFPPPKYDMVMLWKFDSFTYSVEAKMDFFSNLRNESCKNSISSVEVSEASDTRVVLDSSTQYSQYLISIQERLFLLGYIFFD